MGHTSTMSTSQPVAALEQQQQQQPQPKADDVGEQDYQDNDDDDGGPAAGKEAVDTKDMDRFLPIANISRIMKRALPSSAKIAKDAKETEQECVSEFISFITSEASERCAAEKRKTINGDVIIHAMTQLGFTEYIPALQIYLSKYREAIKVGTVGGANKATRKRPAADMSP